jgi:FtsP/CotA-like multicopper oxidase with cupredoxin domain
MQFRVVGANESIPESLPSWDSEYDEQFQMLMQISAPEVLNENIMDDYINMRELWITERTEALAPSSTSAAGGRPLPMLGSRYRPFGNYYDEAVTEEMVQNKPTVWLLMNLSNDAHVIHLHQVRFKIIDRQDMGLSYQSFQSLHAPYRQYAKDPEPAAEYEAGPKDVVVSYPGSITKLPLWFLTFREDTFGTV